MRLCGLRRVVGVGIVSVEEPRHRLTQINTDGYRLVRLSAQAVRKKNIEKVFDSVKNTLSLIMWFVKNEFCIIDNLIFCLMNS